jgi:heat shock protein HtpX
MNILRTGFLLVLLTLLLVWVAYALGLGTTGMVIALAIGLGFNLLNFFFSSKIVLKAYGARVLQEGELQWMQDGIREMTERAGLPMPKVAHIPKSAPNAFATGRSPKHAVVAITQGALDVLDRRQVLAVMGHELAHVKNRDMLTMTIVAGVVSVIGFLAMMARWGMIFGGGRDDEGGGNIIAMLAIAILAPLMAVIVQMAISRSREYAADRGGAGLAQDPEGLASALEALHRGIPRREPMTQTGATAHMMIANPFFGMNIGRLFSSHPDPKERIRRLRAM